MFDPLRYLARVVGYIAGAIGLAMGLGVAFGRLGGIIGAGIAIATLLWVWLWLPRTAHSAFEAGRYAPAGRRYRLIGVLAGSASRRRAALLSRSGCQIALGELDAAEAVLAAIDAELDASARAVWLNNRACAALARGTDPHAALTLVDEAGALRPDVPALQHTRGMALLAVGRIDDAITVLDGMRAAGELPTRLEADRCRDLARAWTRKGEAAYAEDYRLRAEALSR